MKIFSVLAILIAFASCKDARLRQYEKTVAEADSFSVYYQESNKSFSLSKEEIPAFKNLLARSIKPESQRKFMYDVTIDMYKNHKQTAGLMITNNNTEPFVTYRSERLTFGFQLTYGIGIFISNMKL